MPVFASAERVRQVFDRVLARDSAGLVGDVSRWRRAHWRRSVRLVEAVGAHSPERLEHFPARLTQSGDKKMRQSKQPRERDLTQSGRQA
ncbi:MAG: hypothetical protein AAFV86_23975, partial [Pseudomonadota bacterium]